MATGVLGPGSNAHGPNESLNIPMGKAVTHAVAALRVVTDGPLTGKVALVTGGSRGLGRSMVLAFADAGADVVITSRKLDACAAVAAEVEAKGRRALPVACHIGHWDEIDGLVEQAYAAFGRVDVLVNNAGMSPLYPDLTVGERGAVGQGARRQPERPVPAHRARRHEDGGRPIWWIHHQRLEHRLPPPRPGHAALRRGQGGAEHADRGLRQGVRADGAGQLHHGGPVPHRHRRGPWGPAARSSAACRTTPCERAGEPEEIVGAALYFATDASSYTSGAILRVDGGIP